MDKKSLACILASMGTIFLLTGCGAKTVDVFDTMDVEFSGANGYGRANVTGAYDYEDEIVDQAESIGILETIAQLEDSLEITVDKEEGLSNGDKVKVTVEANNDKAKKYGYKFKTGSKTFEVEGLSEAQVVDLFENCVVTYQGMSPYATASVSSAIEPKSGKSVSYKIENNTNLKSGDTVVVTATYPTEESLLQEGYVAKSFTKEYVVEDIPSLPETIAEIPEDIMEAMKKQAEDVCRADNTSTLCDKEKFLDCRYVGAYYLTGKQGYSLNAQNALDLIYKVNVENTDGIVEFYWWCEFSNIVVMADGTGSVDLSNYDKPRTDFMSSDCVRIGNFQYPGFADKETMFNKLVTANIEKYNYENAVTE